MLAVPFIRGVSSCLPWITALLVMPQFIFAGDWPQILGPTRNGHAQNESLADNWTMPPTQVWTVDVGQGYAGPAVVGDQVFVTHRRDQQVYLDCLHLRSGKQIWSLRWKALYRGGIDADTGPRCVPVVHQGRIFVLTAGGDLHAASIDGKSLWSRPLARQYGAQDGYFGFGSTPLVMGNSILINVGGRDNAAVVALDVATGDVQWNAFRDAASYAAPIPWQWQQHPVAVFVTRLNVVGLRPADGTVYCFNPRSALAARR